MKYLTLKNIILTVFIIIICILFYIKLENKDIIQKSEVINDQVVKNIIPEEKFSNVATDSDNKDINGDPCSQIGWIAHSLCAEKQNNETQTVYENEYSKLIIDLNSTKDEIIKESDIINLLSKYKKTNEQNIRSYCETIMAIEYGGTDQGSDTLQCENDEYIKFVQFIKKMRKDYLETEYP